MSSRSFCSGLTIPNSFRCLLHLLRARNRTDLHTDPTAGPSDFGRVQGLALADARSLPEVHLADLRLPCPALGHANRLGSSLSSLTQDPFLKPLGYIKIQTGWVCDTGPRGPAFLWGFGSTAA